jgi:phosphatidate cytidylyltransferase
VKAGDIAAYISGRAIGKHKLTPRISPKKSIEGTVFAVAACTAVVFLTVKIFSKHFYYFSDWEAIIFGSSLGVMGLLGDLSESAIKRQAQVKDSSRLFGDMGGVLDLIDSVVFATPAAYFLFMFMAKV